MIALLIFGLVLGMMLGAAILILGAIRWLLSKAKTNMAVIKTRKPLRQQIDDARRDQAMKTLAKLDQAEAVHVKRKVGDSLK